MRDGMALRLAEAQVCSSPAATGRKHDVVFTFACETWTDAQRRQMCMSADRLLLTLIEDVNVRSLLVANPYRSTPIRWARWLTGHRSAPFPVRKNLALIEPQRLRRRDPTSVPALERAYANYDRALEQAATRIGAQSPVVITGNAFVAAFAPMRWAGRVTFYAWDDWASFPPHRRWWPAYKEAYARIQQSSRSVVGVSPAILDRLAPSGPSAVVANGLAPAEWRSPGPAPAWFINVSSPRIIYVGTLDDRLDIDAILEVSERFSHGTVVLVGPLTDPAALAPLRSVPNVRIQPPVGRAEIVSLVHASDVCVMPHRRTRLTEAMSPLKLYEYVAGGRPVVSTDLPSVRGVDARIVIVPEGESFAAGVSEALNRGPITDRERHVFIDANAWQRRHREILAVAYG